MHIKRFEHICQLEFLVSVAPQSKLLFHTLLHGF